MRDLIKDFWINVHSYYHSVVALLPKLALALVIFTLFLFLARVLQNFSKNRLSRSMDDPLLVRFLSRLIKLVIIGIAITLVLQIVGLGGMAVGLLSTAGLGAFVLGFAFKDIGENFLAGVVLAFKRPFRLGDTVELNGHKGKVVALNLRDIQVKTEDGRDVYIPNALVVKNPVVNFTFDSLLRQELTIELNDEAHVGKAGDRILQTLRNTPGVILGEENVPAVKMTGNEDSRFVLTIHYWIDALDKSLTPTTIRKGIVQEVSDKLGEAGCVLRATGETTFVQE